MNNTLTIAIAVFISLSIMVAYDRFIIQESISNNVSVIDIEHILDVADEQLTSNEISITTYDKRIEYIEQVVSNYQGTLLLKSIRIGNSNRPLVFGGAKDITSQVIENMEQVQ